MIVRNIKTIALIGGINILAFVPACTDPGGDDTSASETSPTTTVTGGATEPTTGDTDPTTAGGEDGKICVNFGGYDGVKTTIGSFVGKVLADERINAYFLNKMVLDDGGARLSDCLTKQVGEAVGCSGVVYDCMDMKTSHAGMGISMNDFNDLATDFSDAMDEVKTLTAEDKMTVLGVLGGMADMIVEDKTNNATVYQVIGRKPNINALIGDPMTADSFVGLVAADTSIVGFFGNTDFDRLRTCLVRQVTQATAGGSVLGSIYGNELTDPIESADPGVSTEKPCLDMKTSHASLMDPGDMLGIQYADFGALVGHLVTAMNNKAVGMTEQNAILGALGPLCPDIVTVDPELCPK